MLFAPIYCLGFNTHPIYIVKYFSFTETVYLKSCLSATNTEIWCMEIVVFFSAQYIIRLPHIFMFFYFGEIFKEYQISPKLCTQNTKIYRCSIIKKKNTHKVAWPGKMIQSVIIILLRRQCRLLFRWNPLR